MSPSATWPTTCRSMWGKPMPADTHTGEYLFQGRMYFYRQDPILCRYHFTFRDPIDPALLQQALDKALGLAPYFAAEIELTAKEIHLRPNTRPCQVRTGALQPTLPAEDGWLMAVSAQEQTIYLDWHHFLADGRGMSRFAALLLKCYCNLRYGTDFATPALTNAPAYDIAALVERWPEAYQTGDFDREVVQTWEGQVHRTLVRLQKQSLVDAALAAGVKPFSALCALLCMAVRPYLDKQQLTFSYTVDARQALQVPEALYNCVASFQGEAPAEQTSFSALAAGTDAAIRHSLDLERIQRQLAMQMGWVYRVSQQKAPLRIQRRLFQMGEYLGGIPADLWVSYLGYPLGAEGAELEDYLTDFQVWVPPDTGSLGVEAASLHGVITLCIENKAPAEGLSCAIRTALERQGVQVLEAVELD